METRQHNPNSNPVCILQTGEAQVGKNTSGGCGWGKTRKKTKEKIGKNIENQETGGTTVQRKRKGNGVKDVTE